MASYLKTGMDSVFDFVLCDTIRNSVKKGSYQGIMKVIDDMNARCRPVNDSFINFTFLEFMYDLAGKTISFPKSVLHRIVRLETTP